MAGLVELRVKKKNKPQLTTVNDLARYHLKLPLSPSLIFLRSSYSQKAEPWPSGVSGGTLAGHMCAGAQGGYRGGGVVTRVTLIDEFSTEDRVLGLTPRGAPFCKNHIF
jgi:hypothetical protein